MCWIDRTTPPLKGPLAAPLKSLICFLASAAQHGCGARREPNWQTAWKTSTCECSFSFLTLHGSRGEWLCYNRKKESEREKKTFSFFFSTVKFLCGPSLKENAAWYEIFQFIRENIGESILYLWVEKIREFLVEKSWSTDTGEAGRINCWQRRLLYQAVVTQGWIFIDLCFYRLVPYQWEQVADDGWHSASSAFNSTTLTFLSII